MFCTEIQEIQPSRTRVPTISHARTYPAAARPLTRPKSAWSGCVVPALKFKFPHPKSGISNMKFLNFGRGNSDFQVWKFQMSMVEFRISMVEIRHMHTYIWTRVEGSSSSFLPIVRLLRLKSSRLKSSRLKSSRLKSSRLKSSLEPPPPPFSSTNTPPV